MLFKSIFGPKSIFKKRVKSFLFLLFIKKYFFKVFFYFKSTFKKLKSILFNNDFISKMLFLSKNTMLNWLLIKKLGQIVEVYCDNTMLINTIQNRFASFSNITKVRLIHEIDKWNLSIYWDRITKWLTAWPRQR